MKNNCNLGVDLGNVITSKTQPYPFVFPDAFEVINKLTSLFNNTYIISRVNTDQRGRAQKWFIDVDFFNKTNIKEENGYFCFDRRDKAIFCRGLNIDYFIDDRADVLRHLPDNTIKLLFQPTKDLEMIENLNNCYTIRDWKDVGEFFHLN